MRQRFKTRKRIQMHTLGNVFVVVVLLVILLTSLFLNAFQKKVTPKLLDVVAIKLDKLTNHYLLEFFNRDILNQESIDQILTITQNSKEEIVSVDFNLEKAYDVLSDATQRMKNGMNSSEFGDINNLTYTDPMLQNNTEGLILMIPMGAASDGIYFTNLGPELPVRIRFVNSLYTNLRTNITDYGINNALVEVNIEIEVEVEIITPVQKKIIKKEYEVTIASKIIQGKVPTYYGGMIENRSPLVSLPQEDEV